MFLGFAVSFFSFYFLIVDFIYQNSKKKKGGNCGWYSSAYFSNLFLFLGPFIGFTLFVSCPILFDSPFLGASFPAFFHQTVVNIEDLLPSGWPDALWLSQSYPSNHFAWHGYVLTCCPPVFVTPASLALFLFVAFVVVISTLHASPQNTLRPECGSGDIFFLYGHDQKEKPNACTVVSNLLSHCSIIRITVLFGACAPCLTRHVLISFAGRTNVRLIIKLTQLTSY